MTKFLFISFFNTMMTVKTNTSFFFIKAGKIVFCKVRSSQPSVKNKNSKFVPCESAARERFHRISPTYSKVSCPCLHNCLWGCKGWGLLSRKEWLFNLHSGDNSDVFRINTQWKIAKGNNLTGLDIETGQRLDDGFCCCFMSAYLVRQMLQ